MLWSTVLIACFQSDPEVTHSTPTEPEGVEATEPEEETGNPEVFGDLPPQLEAFTILFEEDYDTFERASLLSVEGSARDWELGIEGDMLDLHSPGMLDLSPMNGQDVTMKVTYSEWDENDRSIIVADDGGLVYVGGPDAAQLLEEHYGTSIVAYGDTVAQAYESTAYGNVLVGYTMVDISTDEGVVSVLPGELTPIVIDGQSWELVVHGAYMVLSEESDVDCVTRAPVLSLEMIRTDASRQDILERPEGFSKVEYGCG